MRRALVASVTLVIAGCFTQRPDYAPWPDAAAGAGGTIPASGGSAVPGAGGSGGADPVSAECPQRPTSISPLEDFESGPGPAAPADICTMGFFNGLKPDGSSQACDALGRSKRSGCNRGYYCDGCGASSGCPVFVRRSAGASPAPCEGHYYLRFYFNLDSATPCPATMNNAFVGLQLFFSQPDLCLAPAPLDLTNAEAIRMMVRPSYDGFDLEVALADSDLETNPKYTLPASARAGLRMNHWSELRVPVCDLLKVRKLPALRRDSITRLLVGRARDGLMRAGTFVPGTAFLDVDDIGTVPCPPGGCAPCTPSP